MLTSNKVFASLSSFLHSVRFRMALWFAVVLAVVLLIFSVFVYYRTAQDMRDQAASRLALRLRDFNAALRNYRDRFPQMWSPGEGIPPNTFILKEDEVIIVSDPQGAVAGLWGEITEQEAQQLSQQIAGYAPDKVNGRYLTFDVQYGDTKQPIEFLFTPSAIRYDNRLLAWTIMGYPVDPKGQLPRLFWTLVIAGAAMLLLALTGGYWLADRMLWPVKTITRTAQEISETDLSRRLNLHTRDELGALAGTFDSMLDRLQAAFNRQRQFTADASHELRTPLTIIGLETSRALSATRTNEEYRRVLNVIQSENEFMTRLVGELLTLARMDAGQVKLNQEPLDLSDLALDAMERYSPLAARKGICLQTGDMPELPIQGDRQYLMQMIGNLVDNAIKYSPSGEEQWVCIETGLRTETTPPLAWVRVRDNGPGIAPEHIPHIFDRFYRADRARSHNLEDIGSSEEIPGSGLGLSIVQWVAKVHGGNVSAQSQPGEGTTFEVTLPTSA